MHLSTTIFALLFLAIASTISSKAKPLMLGAAGSPEDDQQFDGIPN